ncbi:MAG TPA: GNAT family N-acetyltransferase [Pyrinomonadaceae bacterium]|nr:GNAT family N-acetyltransferase [Pyrinomonadaceae bacterium]
MANGNGTFFTDCRFLSEDHLPQLYEAFSQAFSDYVIPFALTKEQFRNHISLNGVDLQRTVGCFDGERIIGFWLNGFGDWNGKPTVYDAGTGVVPERRRQGLSKTMFDVLLRTFAVNGIEQFLLEVVTTNAAAVELYRNLDFRPVRELALLQCDGDLKTDAPIPADIEICEISEPDWGHLCSFADGQPSWQNSVPAIRRSLVMKRILGAFFDESCVGYVAFSSRFGRLAQIAFDENYRNRGVGTALLRQMQENTAEGFSMQAINIDRSLDYAFRFFLNRGFYERLRQHEMIRAM